MATNKCKSPLLDFLAHSFLDMPPSHSAAILLRYILVLKRIVAPDIAPDNQMASKIHNYTHGINNDPLTLLAIVFSALIHDGKLPSSVVGFSCLFI